MQNLGLAPEALLQHIAWDIGAKDVTRLLAERFGATAILGTVSRLVIDLNRDPEADDAIPKFSDGTAIPGNLNLPEEEIAQRIERYFTPYHAAIEREIARLGRPALISIHSFTPSMNGDARPWHAGILWNQDGRLAQPLIESLSQRPGLCIGDNQPYSGKRIAYSLNRHAKDAGLLHVGIEFRQDLIDTLEKAKVWAEILDETLRPLVMP